MKPTPPPILKMEVSVIGPSQSGQLNRRVTPLYLPRFPSNKGLARLQHSRQVWASCWAKSESFDKDCPLWINGFSCQNVGHQPWWSPSAINSKPSAQLSPQFSVHCFRYTCCLTTMKGMLPNAFPDHRHPVRKCQWEARKSHNQVFFPPYGHESFWS